MKLENKVSLADRLKKECLTCLQQHGSLEHVGEESFLLKLDELYNLCICIYIYCFGVNCRDIWCSHILSSFEPIMRMAFFGEPSG